jgi:hypothetical protein
MSDSYTKLFSSITASTIWMEPAGTRLTWITMLAMTDKHGCVYSSVPGLADRAKVSRQEVDIALACFLAPDPDSRTKDMEGRRVEEIDGGWRLLNHAKFDRMRSEAEAADRRAESKRAWDREHRNDRPNADYRDEITPVITPVTIRLPPSQSVTPLALAPAPVDQELPTTNVVGAIASANALPLAAVDEGRVPIKKIVELYHTLLPQCPRVEKITTARAGHIRQRWREDLPTLDAWGNYFDDVAHSPFLTGRAAGRDGRPPFVANLEWLCRPGNFAKVSEGNFHR